MLNKYVALIIIILLFCSWNLSFYEDYEPNYKIDKSTILFSVMDSTESDSVNFDFDKIAHLIQNKQIIILGEKTYQGGTTFQFKTELVKYLHSKHGFKTILFQAGLHDTYQIKSDTSRLNQALWNVWSNSNEMAGLWDYVGANEDIELAGFDVLLSGNISKRLRAEAIDSILNENAIKVPHIIDSIKPNLRMLERSRRNLSQDTQNLIIKELKVISDKLYQLNKPIDAKYFSNLADWYQCVWKHAWDSSERLHIRDSLMADNLQFQIEHFYKNEKVIVWTSNQHSINSDKDYDNNDMSFTPMGERIKQRYSDKVFTLCTTSYGSENDVSSLYNRGSNRTMEYQLYQNGYKYALIDLSNVGNESFMTRVNQGREFYGKWANMTDAIFYIKSEKEVTYKNED